jgi:hypothetical protein
MKRIEGFSQANALLKTLETADALTVFALVIHNACFMLSNVRRMLSLIIVELSYNLH